MNKDDYYMDIAKAVAKNSKCLRRQYGAVIVNNDEIVATGYNGPPRGYPHCTECKRMCCTHNGNNYEDCMSVHAEQNAMISASRKDMVGGTLYLAGFEGALEITAEPCQICKRMIINSGIKHIVNGEGVHGVV